ncbi:hypothetical protein [Selenomonas ruminantium]|uniref:hypothetical protein n=1 Tax=Selenomonas ruminantium TaxID=971 RepID=UPI0026EAABA8|nr:hypothetical protein [Selenomonas ruminantium]
MKPTGIFKIVGHHVFGGQNHETWYMDDIEMDFSAAFPTANEIRPVNMAVRYLIRAQP